MDQCVRSNGHGAIFHTVLNRTEFAKLFPQAVFLKVVKIEFCFGLTDVLIHQPAKGLNSGIPGISRIIAMAIVASLFEYAVYLIGNRNNFRNMIWHNRCIGILNRPVKLNCYHNQ